MNTPFLIRLARVIALLALGAFAFAWPIRFKTEPKALYQPPSELAEADRIMSERWQNGATLTSEERKNIEALYAEQGEAIAEALGLEDPGAYSTYSRGSSPATSPQALLSSLLSKLTRETSRGLVLALALMLIVLLVVFRSGALRKFLPSVIAILGMMGVVQLTEGEVNLFHLIALFLLAGLSIDYTIFLQSAKRARAAYPVVCSLLTSMAGFGALYFVSFPVVRAFGLVLGLGLPLAFVAGLAGRVSSAEEHRRYVSGGTEKAASPLGLEILFLCYRLLGLRVLHFGAAVVGVSAWIFSRGVRKSSPSIKKTILFTRSLADKLVIMAEGKRLPKVTTDGSPEADEFVAAVKAKEGVFILSSHCGTVETLVALGETDVTFHAWMDVARTSVFNAFYLKHSKRRRVVIHPIDEIGMETAFFAADALERGDSLVMAGDRGRGAFRFANSLDCKVFFVACVATGPVSYKAIIRRLPEGSKAMEKEYQRILAEVTAEYPDQWFEWEK